MPIKVEAAVVTQKQPTAAFNTDSININGKVFPREIIKNGYKGSGVISGNSYFVLSSSAVEGFADATVAAFNNRAETFDVSRDARNVFSGFYEDCRSALLNMDRDENQLKSACLYACGRKTVLACNYDSGLFMFRNGEFSEVNTEQAQATVANYKNRVFSDITAGDIFLLVSSAVSEVLTQKDFGDICKISDGSVKKIVSIVSKVALSKNPSGAVSVFAVKILETAVEDEDSLGFASVFTSRENEENTPAISDETAVKNENPESVSEEKAEENTADSVFVAPASEVENTVENVADINYATDTETAKNIDDSSSNPLDIDNVFDEAESVTDEQKVAEFTFDENVNLSENDENANENTDDEENTEEENSEQGGNKRVKLFIALFSLVALSVFLFIVIFFVRVFSNPPADDVNGTEESSSQTEESTTDEENESETENETTETTSEDETTSEETSSKKEEKTTAKRENETPSRQEPAVVPTPEPETTKAEAENTTEEPTVSSPTESEPSEDESDVSQSETSSESQETVPEQPTQEVSDTPTEEVVDTSDNNLPVVD